MQDGEGYTETGSDGVQHLRGRPEGPRPGRREHVRVRQPGRLLAHHARLPGARPAAHRVRLRALERNPLAAQAIKNAGFDVCCHGWRWVRHFQLSEAEEREHIAKAVASLKQTVGERPAGWYCRYGPSVNTRRLLVEEGGFTYDSDYYGDELPFWQTVEGKPHLIVPYSLTNNDGKYAAGMSHADQWFGLVRDAFDVLHHEGAVAPKMMSVGLHMRLTGHPGRIAGLWRLLDHIQKQQGVWVTSRLAIAKHWMATHPYPGKGLNE
jgi:peptidoglycan/xylan/chitin deacetylase (PgdA/CDA1 family)